MAVLGSFIQQPREALYYTIDYTCFLDPDIPEILNAGVPSIIISPITAPALVVVGQVLVQDNQVRMLVSGGNDGIRYKVEVVVGTDQSQIKEDEFKITVRDQ